MDEEATNGQVWHPGWLWTLRISALIALLPLLTAAILPATQFIPRVIPFPPEKAWALIGLTLVLLLPVSALLPYLMILWRLRRRAPKERALTLAVIVGSWWYTFCSALSLIWFIDRASFASHPPHDQMGVVWLGFGCWLVIGIPHSVLLVSALKTGRF